MGQRRFDDFLGDSLDWIRFNSIAPAAAQSANGRQSLVNRRWNELLASSPFEYNFNSCNLMIDIVTTPPKANHFISDCL
jgi:hypothetical protein